ncbi:cytochrome p450 [Corchorus olitorius]|uniref:Cytochrome p450 n=1 Tax=Corchorus olitorius TaxID=93759 RepID=A0A1R3G1R7_9ROSI|nr:cytochrome p450 [Corchorus olitorius]
MSQGLLALRVEFLFPPPRNFESNLACWFGWYCGQEVMLVGVAGGTRVAAGKVSCCFSICLSREILHVGVLSWLMGFTWESISGCHIMVSNALGLLDYFILPLTSCYMNPKWVHLVLRCYGVIYCK